MAGQARQGKAKQGRAGPGRAGGKTLCLCVCVCVKTCVYGHIHVKHVEVLNRHFILPPWLVARARPPHV